MPSFGRTESLGSPGLELFASSPSNSPSRGRKGTIGGSGGAGGYMGGGYGREWDGEERSVAERRMGALNPRGTLDYVLPGEGAISEYLGKF